MNGVCGAKCEECCLYHKKCRGCNNGCPFGKKCWIASYIELGGKKHFNELKKELIDEINSLKISGMPKLEELYSLQGSVINLEYPIPSGRKVKFLSDNESYLGNQLECIFNDEDIRKCFGIACSNGFILISEYEENGENPEIIYYKRR